MLYYGVMKQFLPPSMNSLVAEMGSSNTAASDICTHVASQRAKHKPHDTAITFCKESKKRIDNSIQMIE